MLSIGYIPLPIVVMDKMMMFKYLKKALKNYWIHNRALRNTSTRVAKQQMYAGKNVFYPILKFT